MIDRLARHDEEVTKADKRSMVPRIVPVYMRANERCYQSGCVPIGCLGGNRPITEVNKCTITMNIVARKYIKEMATG